MKHPFLILSFVLCSVFFALPAAAEQPSPWQMWEAHIYSYATTGQSPYIVEDPKTGEKPLAVVDTGIDPETKKPIIVRLWWNRKYNPAAAQAAVQAKQQAAQSAQPAAAEKAQAPAQQPVASASTPTDQPSPENKEQLTQQLEALLQYYKQQLLASNQATVVTKMDPDFLALLARESQRRDWDDVAAALHSLGKGYNDMASGITETMQNAGTTMGNLNFGGPGAAWGTRWGFEMHKQAERQRQLQFGK